MEVCNKMENKEQEEVPKEETEEKEEEEEEEEIFYDDCDFLGIPIDWIEPDYL